MEPVLMAVLFSNYLGSGGGPSDKVLFNADGEVRFKVGGSEIECCCMTATLGGFPAVDGGGFNEPYLHGCAGEKLDFFRGTEISSPVWYDCDWTSGAPLTGWEGVRFHNSLVDGWWSFAGIGWSGGANNWTITLALSLGVGTGTGPGRTVYFSKTYSTTPRPLCCDLEGAVLNIVLPVSGAFVGSSVTLSVDENPDCDRPAENCDLPAITNAVSRLPACARCGWTETTYCEVSLELIITAAAPPYSPCAWCDDLAGTYTLDWDEARNIWFYEQAGPLTLCGSDMYNVLISQWTLAYPSINISFNRFTPTGPYQSYNLFLGWDAKNHQHPDYEFYNCTEITSAKGLDFTVPGGSLCRFGQTGTLRLIP